MTSASSAGAESNRPLNTEAILSLRDFGVAYGEKVILSRVNLDVPEHGVVVLMGPAGTGKSTLVRTLAGFNSASPSLRLWGQAHYLGEPLGDREVPALVAQNARLLLASVLENIVCELPERKSLTLQQQRDLVVRLLEQAGLAALKDQLDESVVTLPLGLQRHLAILRTVAASPKLLCVDEPTTGIDEKDAEALLEFIAQEAEKRALLVVLHNQHHARQLQGKTALLAGGWIHEENETLTFLSSPNSLVGKNFVRSGTCSVPSPDANPEYLDVPEELVPPPLPAEATDYVSDAFGPRGFLWLKRGILAGTPRPGIVIDMKYDLQALQRVGVTVLVSLTERPLDVEELRTYGIDSIRFPMPDMQAPAIEDAMRYCAEMEELMRTGKVIAVHCRAGLGRTGTMLAAQLIWEGAEALEALEKVRRIEPRWVQSDVQVEFLENFAQAVANRKS